MKIGIYGYGNIGRGVELAVQRNSDMELFGVFTRRDPGSVKTLTGAAVYAADDALLYRDEIDVMVICGGSATDLPRLTPMLAENFNVVDSFDTHAKIPQHFEKTDASAKSGGHVAVISGGWDPGMFSLARVYSDAILPDGCDYTFWGRGVSQGHSDAIRHIEGVKDARQYTVPVEAAMEAALDGKPHDFTAREKHLRECYVAAEEGADKERIEQQIKTMPDYFADYDTTVEFISEEEMKKNHSELPHGGVVIRTGHTGLNGEHAHSIEYRLKLDSNPEFTGSILAALARAAYRKAGKGETGCMTVLDIAPAELSPVPADELRRKML